MIGVSCMAWLGTWTKGRDESLNAREFKRTERRGVGSSITDDVFKSFFYAGEQSNGVGDRKCEIKREDNSTVVC